MGVPHTAAIDASSTGAATRDFERLYRDAQGDPAKIPWADLRANPLLVSWLDRHAADHLRPGSRAAVVGCGLGHDARELARRGYDVSAFDVSPTAVEWAKSIDPDWATIFSVADLFALPSRWRHRFDFVFESYTIQSLPRESRPRSMSSIVELLHPHGQLLMVCRGCEQPGAAAEGPPWPLTVDEIRELATPLGLDAPDGYEVAYDDESPPSRRIRALLRRPS